MTRTSSPPLVSVVIPSYQHAAYVQRAVESVLQQTVTNIEVIVVDDGSTDGTPDIVAKIPDPRLRLVRLAENRREHARNLGLGLATGHYVAFQNSDDEWLPQKLASQLDVMETRLEVGAVFSAVEVIDGNGNPATDTWANGLFFDGGLKWDSSEWLRALFYNNSLCIVSAMVRHDLLRQTGGFRPSMIQMSDYDMWIRLAALSELEVIAEPLIRMRVDGHRNLSAPTREASARSALEMVDVLENYARAPLLERLPSLFPDVCPGNDQDPVVNLAAFACFAANGGTAHRLFADRVLSRLIDDADSRQKLIKAFGAGIIKCFLERRAAWADV